ncbi:MAG: tetratricopeptide repeat protein [Gemmatimonadetes bacterium]|nr:tetratricopeptide repeat protein [Gemmatimonadota bacterium]
MGPKPAIQQMDSRTGERVVLVNHPRTFAEIAREVYGDEKPAATLAALAGLPADEPAPAGTVLVVPPAGELESRRQAATAAQREFEAGLTAAKREGDLAASAHFKEALRLAPWRDDIRYNLGLSLLAAGFPLEALPPLEETARRRPDHAESRYALGSALRGLKAWDRAEREFDAAISLAPDHVAARLALARTHWDQGDTEGATAEVRDLIARYPDDPVTKTARQWLARATDQKVGASIRPQP